MKKLTNTILFILILLSSACEKKTNDDIGDTIVFGTVVDSETNQPIEGVIISKVNVYHGAVFYSDTIFIVQTGIDGKYEFKQKLTYPKWDDVSDYYFFNFRQKDYYGCNLSYDLFHLGTINENNIVLVRN
jgi:hypothetical protein